MEDKEFLLLSKAFFDDLEKVFKKHGLSLSHQDHEGAFGVDIFCDENLKWLKDAYYTEEAKELILTNSAKKEDK